MGFLRKLSKHFIKTMKDNRGFLQTLIPLAIAGYSAYNASKKPKQQSNGSPGSVQTDVNMPDWQAGLGSDLSNWARKYLQMYQPGEAYKGNLSAGGPSNLEGMGLGELEKLLQQPATGELFGAAKGQVLDTLSGKYADPNTSPFIQSYTKLAKQNLQDSITTERGQRGARGTFFTRAGVDAESRLSERTQNTLNALIGDFMNQERGRQFSAATTAKDLEGFANNESLKRVAASQTFGSLPRLLEQADLERQYNAWLNQRNELGRVPGVAQSAFGTNVPTVTTVTPPTPSGPSGQDISPWISLAMKFLPELMAAA